MGTNILSGPDPEKVRAAADDILNGRVKSGRIPDLWDGHTAERILEVLKREL